MPAPRINISEGGVQAASAERGGGRAVGASWSRNDPASADIPHISEGYIAPQRRGGGMLEQERSCLSIRPSPGGVEHNHALLISEPTSHYPLSPI